MNCGTVGLANLEKRHRGKKVCKAAQEKRDKNVKKRKEGNILNFLQPKAITVASTLSSRAPVHGAYVPQSATHTRHTILPRQRETVSLPSQPVSEPISNFINTLRNLVEDLPDSVPEASEFDKLAVFGRSPKEFDVPTSDADELWETTLNHVLKSTLGWGTEGNMNEIIRRGKWGMDGLVKFATYFMVEQGVSEGLFEGKLETLVEALKKRLVKVECHQMDVSPKVQGQPPPAYTTSCR